MKLFLRAASLATAVTLLGGCAALLAQRAPVNGNWPTYHLDASGVAMIGRPVAIYRRSLGDHGCAATNERDCRGH